MSFYLEKANGFDKMRGLLLKTLDEAVKQIEFEINIRNDVVMELNEATCFLCTILESIFLHGLKDSFLHETLSALGGKKKRPQPSFWAPLLVFLHKDILKQIKHLTNIKTEIGQSRSWIRLSLNDAIFAVYLINMKQNSQTLSHYYKKHAFLKDIECLERMIELIIQLEPKVKFKLPYNTSLLNSWPDDTLQLAGVWNKALKPPMISRGFDVATIVYREPSSILSSPEDIISCHSENALQEISTSDFIQNSFKITELTKELWEIRSPEQHKNESEIDTSPSALRPSDLNLRLRTDNADISSIKSFKYLDSMCSTNCTLTLVESNHKTDWENIWKKIVKVSNLESLTPNELENDKKESLEPDLQTNFQLADFEELGEKLFVLAVEQGLDAQGFMCKACLSPLRVSAESYYVCALSGSYFCIACISPALFMIPSKILFNSDFHTYKVSQKAAFLLTEFELYPFFDLNLLNPSLYKYSKKMMLLFTLRVRLNIICSFVRTCSTQACEEIWKALELEAHLFETVHLYSLSNLNKIENGELKKQLDSYCKSGETHLRSCSICSKRGVICGICNDKSLVYAFDINKIFKCTICETIYHEKCLSAAFLCPKCES